MHNFFIFGYYFIPFASFNLVYKHNNFKEISDCNYHSRITKHNNSLHHTDTHFVCKYTQVRVRVTVLCLLFVIWMEVHIYVETALIYIGTIEDRSERASLSFLVF